jgi:hypothetical protein
MLRNWKSFAIITSDAGEIVGFFPETAFETDIWV